MYSILPTFIHHSLSQAILQPSINQELMGREWLGSRWDQGMWDLSRFGQLVSVALQVRLCHQSFPKFRGSGLCSAAVIAQFELAWYKGNMQHRQNWECFVCFPDDLDAHSCAPSAASSEEGTWQSRNISYPFFILAKRLAEAASREECGPLVLNQSIHAPLHTCSPPLSSFYTASPSAGGEHRTYNSEDSIWLWDLTALCSSVWHRSLSPRHHPSAEPRSWGWLPICSSPGINYPHTKHRQKYSSTRAFAMDENWLRALFLAHTKSTPRQAKAFFLGKLSLLRGGILHLSQVGVRFLVYVT